MEGVDGVVCRASWDTGTKKAFWGMAGLLHDIDFELYPEEHCERAPELLRDGGAEED